MMKRDSLDWGSSLFVGAGLGAVAYLSHTFGQYDIPTEVVACGFVGVGSALAMRQPVVAAVGGAYLAYEFLGAAAQTTGHVLGAVAGGIAGWCIGHMIDEDTIIPSIVVGGVCATGGYFVGGIGAAIAVVGLGGVIAGALESKKGLEFALAAAVGYFSTTMVLEKEILPHFPAPPAVVKVVPSPKP